MYLIAIAWMYVALMMALAEATAANGSVLGAVITFLLYGALPCALLMYILGTPERKRRLHAQRLQEQQQWQAEQAAAQHASAAPQAADSASYAIAPDSAASAAPDDSGHTPGAAQDGGIAPVREKP